MRGVEFDYTIEENSVLNVDIECERGGHNQNRLSNKKFYAKIDHYCLCYGLASNYDERQAVVDLVINWIRKKDRRFVQRIRGTSNFGVLKEEDFRQKIQQRLRERFKVLGPEFLEYLAVLLLSIMMIDFSY